MPRQTKPTNNPDGAMCIITSEARTGKLFTTAKFSEYKCRYTIPCRLRLYDVSVCVCITVEC